MTITSNSLTADLPADVKDKVRDAKETAQDKIQDIKQHLHDGTEALQDKAGAARDLTGQAVAKLPAPVVGRITQLMAAVRRRPVPAVAVLLGVLLVLRRVLRRNS